MADLYRQDTDSTKKALKRYKKNKDVIQWLYERRSRLVARIESLKSPGISDMPKGGDHRSKEDLIAEKVDIERRIQKYKDKGVRIKSEITDMIDTLDDRHEAEVLERYLIYCQDFGEIADAMGYTERHVIRLYTSAVTKIAQVKHETVTKIAQVKHETVS